MWSSAAAMLLLGVAAGFAWERAAHPAEWLVRPDGSIVLTEAASRDQFGVVVVFVTVGAVTSLIFGIGATLAMRELGWRLTPLIVVATLLGAVVAWQVGIELGPVGPQDAVDPGVGDLLPSKLEIDSIAAFFVWPVFGVAGLMLAEWLSKDTAKPVEAWSAKSR
ncbi:MAG: hypothetical protein ABIN55_10420 [Aeromicrobium sp.]